MAVYITQEVRGRDITDASTFGDLEILIPAEEQAAWSTQPAIRKINRKLSKFNDQDYILLAGDPAIIALSAGIGSRHNNGRVKMLKWDRQLAKYLPLEADLYHKTGDPTDG